VVKDKVFGKVKGIDLYEVRVERQKDEE